MADTEMIDCPFCGSDECTVEQVKKGWYSALCGNCEAEGPPAYSNKDARLAWNGRPKQYAETAYSNRTTDEAVEALRLLDQAIPFRLSRIAKGECVDASVAAISSALPNIRAALASRPAEVDDEVAGFEKTLRQSQVTMDPEIASVLGNNLWDLYESDQEELPTLPQGVAVMEEFPRDQAASRHYTPYRPAWLGSFPPTGSMLYTAEQYRQGQRDAVAAMASRIAYMEAWLKQIATVNAMDYEYQKWARQALSAPSHTTNKEK